jgi:uncharacterized delta-60 repeat protein
VVAGIANDGTPNANFGIARYLADGKPDPTFSGDGNTTTDFAGGSDEAFDLVRQPDGKIVVVGSAEDGTGDPDFAVARYKANGALDATFSDDGRRTFNVANDVDEAYGVALQPDGKIVAAGEADQATTSFDFALARFKANGGVDQTFSGDGKVSGP